MIDRSFLLATIGAYAIQMVEFWLAVEEIFVVMHLALEVCSPHNINLKEFCVYYIRTGRTRKHPRRHVERNLHDTTTLHVVPGITIYLYIPVGINYHCIRLRQRVTVD